MRGGWITLPASPHNNHLECNPELSGNSRQVLRNLPGLYGF
jgi:hypothetical protein